MGVQRQYEVMTIQRPHALGAGPGQRSERRTGYADGFQPEARPTRPGPPTGEVPQARGVGSDPSAREEGVRSARALTPAAAEMGAQGAPAPEVAAITERLGGLGVTSGRVSRAAAVLGEELRRWRGRPIGEAPYLIRDARYEKVRHGSGVVPCAALVASGIDEGGQRPVLGVRASLSEAEAPGRGFRAAPPARGLHGVRRVVSDAHAGRRGALAARLTGVPWQRCQSHRMKGAPDFVPRPPMRAGVTASPRAVVDAPGRAGAQRLRDLAVKKYRAKAPERAGWLGADVPAGPPVFALRSGRRPRLRTSNRLERLGEEFRRRTRAAGLFPSEASALRLVSAVLVEISEGWESGRKCLGDRRMEISPKPRYGHRPRSY